MSSFDAMRELSDEVVRLRSDLKAKDAEITSLKAENEALKVALEKIVEIRDTHHEAGAFGKIIDAWKVALLAVRPEDVNPKYREALSQSKTEAS